MTSFAWPAIVPGVAMMYVVDDKKLTREFKKLTKEGFDLC